MKKKLQRLLRNPHPLLTVGFILGGVAFIGAGGILISIALTPTPDLAAFEGRKVSDSTKLYDRTGETLLYDLDTDAKRERVPLAEISPRIREAAIATEDSGFYEHGGISITGITRALLRDALILLQLSDGYVQGGSTITQQVVKNTLLTGKKSPARKIHEIILAIKLEQVYTKDQILEAYLNEMPYGGPYYGVETASRAFFGKSARDVGLAESAYLAAVLQAPTYYSPYGNHREELDARKNFVLERMSILGYITEDEKVAAQQEVVTFAPQRASSIIAPHFVFYVREQLENTYGPTVVDQGLKVITTLDAELQTDAEAIVSEWGARNEERFNATNAALVAIDPKTGQILSMVGSRDYFEERIQGSYNATIANRQPGSSFKPIIYATALSRGYAPTTAIFDLPTQFSTSCSPSDNRNNEYPCYAPSNYDGQFRGPMNFTTALAQSINIPAVKVLYLAGVQNVVDMAESVGISTLGDPKQYGLAFALGAAEVKLLELTNAYATFAADGVYRPTTPILSVTDANGTVLEEYKDQPVAAVDPGVARDLSSMLSNNAARQPGYAPNNPMYIPGYDVAAKTGTTNDFRDTWTVGYTPSIAVGVWAGNNDNTPMMKETAGYVVAPMWRAFMDKALPRFPVEYFGPPRGLAEDAKPIFYGNYAADGVHDVLHYVDRANPTGPAPSNPANDGQYRYWEYAVSAWANANPGILPPGLDLTDGNVDEEDEEDDNDRRRNRDDDDD